MNGVQYCPWPLPKHDLAEDDKREAERAKAHAVLVDQIRRLNRLTAGIASPEIWKALRNQFNALPAPARAVWYSATCDHKFEDAKRQQVAEDGAAADFLSLAAEAARATGYNGPDPAQAWMDELLALYQKQWKTYEIDLGRLDDGIVIERGAVMILSGPCQASANLCARFARDAQQLSPMAKAKALVPEEALTAKKSRQESIPEPLTVEQLKRRLSLSQAEAAATLAYRSTRQIRKLLQMNALSKVKGGRVANNEKFNRLYRQRHKQIVG